MSEKRTYAVGLRFTVNDGVPPRRTALHTALQTVRAVTVEASTVEEAEAQVDQIRIALEGTADQRRVRRRARDPSGGPVSRSRSSAE